MDWMRYIDAYCERVEPGYWAEPVNALTNASFLIAAAVMALRLRGSGLALCWALVAALVVIGVGSYLWHTHAQVWSVTIDTGGIALFILIYLYAANRHFWGLSWPWALAGTVAFVPYAAAAGPLFDALPFFTISSFYWPVAALILGYGIALRARAPDTARGLAIGGGILVASLVFRSLDGPLCIALPVGTHFLWHLLNGLMLGWMIEVLRRHMLAARAGRG